MNTPERRQQLLEYLSTQSTPVSGTVLSAHFGVSRQIIVQDIAELREKGHDIISSHFGYLLHKLPLYERTFKVYHTSAQTEDELTGIINLGGTIMDVYVWHKVYGRICAPLNIGSLEDVKQFLEGVRTGKSVELMNITGGYHYHTVRANSEEILDQIALMLSRKNYTAPEL